ncbi:MAG: hypothetical protein KF861_18485, partial [Planctomycetaceae bacterium]|nr:hypothetical protein [Planctomycetaceae bacterium]
MTSQRHHTRDADGQHRFHDQTGASLVELAVAACLIIVIALIGVAYFGDQVGKSLCDATSQPMDDPTKPGLGLD